MAKKFYVVWKGRKPGIYESWEECSKQVTGYRDAEYKSFGNRAAAEEAYRGRYEDYVGKFTSSLSDEELQAIGSPIQDAYAVDAACSGSPGPVEYQCVHVGTGRRLFHQGPFENGTNNIGEFLALVHALALFKRKGIAAPIYTDSKDAMLWIEVKKCRTNLKQGAKNSELFKLIERAEKWLCGNEFSNQILKWETKAWGEIPADFGRK